MGCALCLKKRSPRFGGFAYLFFVHLGDGAGTNGAAAFTNSKLRALLHSDGLNQLDRHRNVVAGHYHLDPGWESEGSGHVGGSEVELRAVASHERGVASTF